jgi:hypothetical protein
MKTLVASARSLALPALLACLSLMVACGGDQDSTQAAGQAKADAPQMERPAPPPGTDHPAPAAGDAVIAGITVTLPTTWQDVGPSGMRKAQYRLPAQGGDAEGAEVNVFYFGPASGGGVEANLQRWIGQMTADVQPSRSTFTADGMNGHLVSLDGTYNAGGMRPMGGGGGEAKPGYRLVGGVLEGPEGSVFFKLTGPVGTAQAMEDDLLTMVKGARKAS